MSEPEIVRRILCVLAGEPAAMLDRARGIYVVLLACANRVSMSQQATGALVRADFAHSIGRPKWREKNRNKKRSGFRAATLCSPARYKEHFRRSLNEAN